MIHTQKPNSTTVTEVDQLQGLGPLLDIIEPQLQPQLTKLMNDYPDMLQSYEEMLKTRIIVPAPWFVWMCGAVSYMLTRHRLLRGEAVGTTEQPN